MDSRLTTIPDTTTQTVSKGQLEALKGAIRAAATSNPAGMDHSARCRALTQTLCGRFQLRRLADLPECAFQAAMKAVADMAVPQRRHGPAEASLRTARDGLAEALASILQAKRGIAAFRREVEGALLAPLKDALDVAGAGVLEAVVQDGVGCLLAMPLLQAEHELDILHEHVNVLASRLPAIGRALDERRPAPAMLSAD